MVAGGDKKSKFDTFYFFPLLEFANMFELFEV